jgi:hypothetical protein
MTALEKSGHSAEGAHAHASNSRKTRVFVRKTLPPITYLNENALLAVKNAS